MVRFGNNGFRDIFDERFFGLQRVLAVRRQTQPFAYPENMRIHRHGGLIPNHRTYHVRRLATDSLQRLQVLDIVRYDAVIDLYQPLRHLYQVLRFRARITDGLYVFEHLIACGFCHCFRRRVGGKEGRRHHVHPLVRTLRGKHNGHKALERIDEYQLTFRYRHVGFKPRQYMFKPLFGRHDRCDLKTLTLGSPAFARKPSPD